MQITKPEEASNEEHFQKLKTDDNLDEKITAQVREIESEVNRTQELVGDRIDISALKDEYQNEDEVYHQKLKDICSRYKAIRTTRRDGNCFFRAFAFSYFEKLMENEALITKLKSTVTHCGDELVKLGYCQFTVEDFRDVFIDILDQLVTMKNVEDLEKIFRDSGTSDYLVVFMRLIVSCHLQNNLDFFQCFIDGYPTIKEFCANEVEPMYRESDHIHVIALTKELDVSIRIVYMDRTNQEITQEHTFPEDCKEPFLNLLYRPGHYDIIYP